LGNAIYTEPCCQERPHQLAAILDNRRPRPLAQTCHPDRDSAETHAGNRSPPTPRQQWRSLTDQLLLHLFQFLTDLDRGIAVPEIQLVSALLRNAEQVQAKHGRVGKSTPIVVAGGGEDRHPQPLLVSQDLNKG